MKKKPFRPWKFKDMPDLIFIRKKIKELEDRVSSIEKDKFVSKHETYFIKEKPVLIGLEFDNLEDVKKITDFLYNKGIPWMYPQEEIRTHLYITKNHEEIVSELCKGISYIIYEDHDAFLKSVQNSLKNNQENFL